MSGLSDLFSGDPGSNGGGDGQAPDERAEQLRRGTESAAAALPDEHAELGSRALAAAEAAVAALAGDEEGGADGSLLDSLQRLHFLLVGLGVETGDSTPGEVEEQIEAVLRRAGAAGTSEGLE
ncbi:MAG TPA: hypothetical protein VKB18_07745 [Gemmatimonadota bacterium]|nr:hypothetical protein [Gemmatimonadota bacterium]